MKRELSIFFSILFIILSVVIFKAISWPLFKIKRIECQLDNSACPEPLQQSIASLYDQSFFFTQIAQDVAKLNLDLYQLAYYTKKWPNQLKLHFSSKNNNYLLALNSASELYLVTENGFIFPTQANNSAPQVELKNWPDALDENKINPKPHLLIMNLLKSLNYQQIKVNSIAIYQPNYIEIKLDNKLVVIAQELLLEQQIAQLAIMLDKLDFAEIDQSIKEIDLRFKFPILRTKLSSPPI